MIPFRSKYIGGEIDLPDGWAHAANPSAHGEEFTISPNEKLRWMSAHTRGLITPEMWERDFKRAALNDPDYYDCEPELGRFSLLGREHAWARHKLWRYAWAKTYMIQFGRASYYVLGFCPDRDAFARLEPQWDALVDSFRPLPTYPEAYDAECRLNPGPLGTLRLDRSQVFDSPWLATLGLMYQWDGVVIDPDDAECLAWRAAAYISCAIYDAANEACIGCMPSPIPHGRRPAWLIDQARAPTSITDATPLLSDARCEIIIGPAVFMTGGPKPISAETLERIRLGFEARFPEIRV